MRILSLALLYWIWPVAYMVLIFILSSSPLTGKIPLIWIYQDKVIHFVEYGILAFLLARALTGPDATPKPWRPGAALLLTVIFGVSDEIHQSMVPGRDASFTDLLANTVGAMAGVLLWTVLVHCWATMRQKNAIIPKATAEGTPKGEK